MKRLLHVVAFLFFTTASTAAAVELPEAFDFSLKDQNGQQVQLSSYEGSVVVLEWITPACSYVKRHYEEKTAQKLYEQYKEKGLVWVTIVPGSGMEASIAEFVEEYSVPFSVVSDPKSETKALYEVQLAPHVVVISRGGRIAYSGGIDNDSNGTLEPEFRTNFLADAIEKAFANDMEYLPYQDAYGCRIP
jgi:peroxiredoxin